MGHNWSELQGSQMVPPIRKPLQPLLSPPNPDSSALYTLTKEAVAPVVPITRNLHQHSSLMCTHRSAAPPCPTISIFTFPGTLPPDTFHDIPECFRLTFSSTAPRVYHWNRSLVKYMGRKTPAEQPQSSPEKDKEEDTEEKNILFDTVTTLDKQLTTATCCASPMHCL
jgi:hypothetical protein